MTMQAIRRGIQYVQMQDGAALKLDHGKCEAWLQREGEPEQAVSYEQYANTPTAPATAPAPTGGLAIVSGAQWLEQADSEQPAIIAGLLPAQSLAFVAGEPGVGKSWLVWGLALAVQTGKPFLGHYPVKQPGPVLMVASEGSRKASKGRAWAIAAGMDLDPGQAIGAMHLMWRTGFSLTDAKHVGQVEQHVREQGVRLVVIDTLHGTWGGAENDSQAWAEVMRVGLRPIMEAGATVVLVHHSHKSSDATASRRAGQRMRGSGAMHGSRDALMVLSPERDAEHRVRVTVELRDDAPMRPFTFATPAEHVGVGDSLDLDWQQAGDEPAPSRARTEADIERDVLAKVAAEPGRWTAGALSKDVRGRNERVRKVIDAAVADGRLTSSTPLGHLSSGNNAGTRPEPSGTVSGNGAASPQPDPRSLPLRGDRGTGDAAGAGDVF